MLLWLVGTHLTPPPTSAPFLGLVVTKNHELDQQCAVGKQQAVPLRGGTTAAVACGLSLLAALSQPAPVVTVRALDCARCIVQPRVYRRMCSRVRNTPARNLLGLHHVASHASCMPWAALHAAA